MHQRTKYIITVVVAVIVVAAVFLASSCMKKNAGKTEKETSQETSEETSKKTSAETSSETSEETSVEASEASPTESTWESTAAKETEKLSGPAVPEGPVKEMLKLALTKVSCSMGYSLIDRTGANGSFDCSGFTAVMLRDGLSEQEIGWFGSDAWDTAYWRYYGSCFQIGDRVMFGNALYEVTLQDSYDYEKAWSVPGAIVIQYPPENDPSVTMGHASIALGEISYETTEDVICYIEEEYGVSLRGTAGGPNALPMVYDGSGAGTGHNVWKINANGVAEAVIVDNNFANDPSWIEKIAVVFSPVQE